MTPKQGLTKSRDYMLKHGFCKNTIEDDDGRVCVIGAIGRGVGWDPDVFQTIRDALAKVLKVDALGLVSWNNAKGRTKRQVIAGFNKAIKAH